jgi:hypothetical protein
MSLRSGRPRSNAREAATGCASVCTDAEGRNQIVVALGANILATDVQVEDALLAPGNTLVTQMEADPASTARLSCAPAREALARSTISPLPRRSRNRRCAPWISWW